MPQIGSSPREPGWRPLALGIGLTAIGLSIAFRLIPYDVRPANLVPIGAMCLYAGARMRFWQASTFPLAAMAITDIGFYFWMGWPPSLASYVSYAIYIVLAGALLRNTESPLRIGLVALAGSVQFFLITNFAAWLSLAHDYPRTVAGLIAAYEQGLPFYRATLIGDAVFTAVFFGAHAWLARTYFPAEQVVSSTRVEEART